ncbi:MAG: DnaA/Hda family protein [Burkholderiales bacterium]
MRQLSLAMQPPRAPTLDNFVPGANAELLARLRELAAGTLGEAVIYLWGETGSGRSHLLAACSSPGVCVADDVDALDEAAQISLFNRINEAREHGGKVLAAGSAPPAQLKLRDDLRSRLGWGLVYQVKALTDDDRALYLAAEGSRRGLELSDEVIRYLLSHVRRDMPSLDALVDHLDRHALEKQRRVTLPLVREALSALRRD